MDKLKVEEEEMVERERAGEEQEVHGTTDPERRGGRTQSISWRW